MAQILQPRFVEGDMRLLILGVAIALGPGCVAPGVVQNLDTDGSQPCADIGAAYRKAASADLQFTNLLVNQYAMVTDVTGVRGCVDDLGSVVWLIDDNDGVPYMRIFNGTDSTGAIDVNDGEFRIELYGNEPPLVFQSSDFYTQQWVVTTLEPFEATFFGSAVNPAGHTLDLGYYGGVSL